MNKNVRSGTVNYSYQEFHLGWQCSMLHDIWSNLPVFSFFLSFFISISSSPTSCFSSFSFFFPFCIVNDFSSPKGRSIDTIVLLQDWLNKIFKALAIKGKLQSALLLQLANKEHKAPKDVIQLAQGHTGVIIQASWLLIKYSFFSTTKFLR